MILKFRIIFGLVNNKGAIISLLVNHKYIKKFIPKKDNDLIEIKVDNNRNNVISIELTGKKDNDTVIKNSKIVHDKFFLVDSIWVDDILISNNFNAGKVSYYTSTFTSNQLQQNQLLQFSNSMYLNGKIEYVFETNFFNWYYDYNKAQDLLFIKNHSDSEAEEKYLGYEQESTVEKDILDLLKQHGYTVTC